MKDSLLPLLQLQRFFLPTLVALLLWAVWRTVWRKDQAVGLALYLGLVIVVDGYLNTGIFIPGLEKGSIRYSEVCALFVLFNRPAPIPNQTSQRAVRMFVTLYFTLLLVSAFRSEPIMAGIFEYRRLIVPQIIAFVIAMRGLRAPDDFRRFCLCMMSLSLVIAVVVFWDLFFDRVLIHSDMLATPEYYLNRQHGRFGSLFLNPNYLGAFVVLTFPAAFVSTLNETTTSLKLFGLTTLLALGFCLVETQSRAPLLAFGGMVLLLLVGPAGGVSRAKRVGVFVPFALIFTLLLPGFLEHATERFDQIDDEMSTESARTRQTIWRYTARAVADYPLMGIGFGEQQFVRVIRDEYHFEDDYGEGSLDNPHNSYLQMTVYAGISALLAFLLANFLLLLGALRSLRRGPIASSTGRDVFGLMIGVIGFLVVIYPDMHMFTQTVAPVYWVFFGLLLSMTAALPQTSATTAAVRATASGMLGPAWTPSTRPTRPAPASRMVRRS